MTASALRYSRRHVLKMAVSAAAVSAVPALGRAQGPASDASNRQFAVLLNDFADEILTLSP
ncbi:MAG: twin-arginine translocation signal domain-containing protein, partial [Pseudomonadota bacterium]|nr:twin-arginine translocation signal domain-containing protein [Pseudomonadota bacterium]